MFLNYFQQGVAELLNFPVSLSYLENIGFSYYFYYFNTDRLKRSFESLARCLGFMICIKFSLFAIHMAYVTCMWLCLCSPATCEAETRRSPEPLEPRSLRISWATWVTSSFMIGFFNSISVLVTPFYDTI